MLRKQPQQLTKDKTRNAENQSSPRINIQISSRRHFNRNLSTFQLPLPHFYSLFIYLFVCLFLEIVFMMIFILKVATLFVSILEHQQALAQVGGGYMQALQKRCCDYGQNYAGRTLSSQRDCKMFDRYPPELSNEERDLCREIGHMCCLKEVQMQQCTAGRQTAFTRHVCEIPPQNGDETFKECCTCCKLGMAAARLRENCNLLKIGNPCDMAFRECCFNSSVGGPGTSSCDRYNPCEQICEEDGSEIKCSCYPGYEPDPSNLFNCIDVDECSRGISTCQPNQSCFNKKGSYECVTLPPGSVPHANFLQEFDTNNVAVDEEDLLDEDFDVGQPLTPPYGQMSLHPNELEDGHLVEQETAWATCPRGYALNEDNDRCLDIDECILYPEICEYDKSCFNLPGSYECKDGGFDAIGNEPTGRIAETCPNGFKMNPITGACESEYNQDYIINSNQRPTPSDGIRGYPLPRQTASTARSSDCPSDVGCSHICRMVDGLPQCSCNSGYQLADDKIHCEDIDECTTMANNCSQVSQVCRNLVGSYVCDCRAGFQKMIHNPYECEDVNECALELDNCESGQRCENTLGSFECRRQVNCPTGYTLDAATQQCHDVDECKLGLHNCGNAYHCFNTRGSFRCERKQCDFGKRLNVNSGECEDVQCSEGYKVSPDGQCQDIDECRLGTQCKVYQRCVNTPGSYSCQNIYNCPQGYEFSESGHCIDIDECAKGIHDCKPNQVCTNRPGGHTCSCHAGFELGPDRECQGEFHRVAS